MRQETGTCKDTIRRKKCLKIKKAGNCTDIGVKEKCQKTCGFCGKCYGLQHVSIGNRIYESIIEIYL